MYIPSVRQVETERIAAFELKDTEEKKEENKKKANKREGFFSVVRTLSVGVRISHVLFSSLYGPCNGSLFHVSNYFRQQILQISFIRFRVLMSWLFFRYKLSKIFACNRQW